MFIAEMIVDQATRTYNIVPVRYDFNPQLKSKRVLVEGQTTTQTSVDSEKSQVPEIEEHGQTA